MSHLDQMIADALAQSRDTVVHQLASEVVRLRAESADRMPGEGEVRVRWIPVSEAIPQDRQNIGFIASCERDDFLHGRVYGGNFNARDFENRFGGFQAHGFSCMASHWFPFPLVPDALRAQPTTERGGDTDGCSICGKHMRLEEIEPNVTPATHIACWQRHRQPTQEPTP